MALEYLQFCGRSARTQNCNPRQRLLSLFRAALCRYLLPSLARPGLREEHAAIPRKQFLVEFLAVGTYYNDHRWVGAVVDCIYM
jgi:hypothetical protein